MAPERVLQIYRECNAFLEADQKHHFELASGKHSGQFLQSAAVFMHPWHAVDLAQALVDRIKDYFFTAENIITNIGSVVSPAVGAIILCHAAANILKSQSFYAEKTMGGEMYFRHGLDFDFSGMRFVALEDVVTTGGTLKKVMKLIESKGGEVLLCGTVIDRSEKPIDFGCPFISLAKIEIPIYDPDKCPYCKQGSRAVKVR